MFMMTAIWIIYFVHNFFMVVVLLNFVIAVVGTSYAIAEESLVNIIYKQRAELTRETFAHIQTVQKQNDVQPIRMMGFVVVTPTGKDFRCL